MIGQIRITIRNFKPSDPIAMSKADIHFCFFANFNAVFLNMYRANSMPVIEPNQNPSQIEPVAITSAYQKLPYAFISPKPAPRTRAIPGIIQVEAMKKRRTRASGPSHRSLLNHSTKAVNTIFVMSRRTIMKMVPPTTITNVMMRHIQTYQGLGLLSSSESSSSLLCWTLFCKSIRVFSLSSASERAVSY